MSLRQRMAEAIVREGERDILLTLKNDNISIYDEMGRGVRGV